MERQQIKFKHFLNFKLGLTSLNSLTTTSNDDSHNSHNTTVDNNNQRHYNLQNRLQAPHITVTWVNPCYPILHPLVD